MIIYVEVVRPLFINKQIYIYETKGYLPSHTKTIQVIKWELRITDYL
jgi:hypothetical protein